VSASAGQKNCQRPAEKVFAHQTHEERSHADEQGQDLTQPRRGGDRHGREHEDRLQHHRQADEELRIDVGPRVLEVPVAIDDADDAEGEREGDAEACRERRGKRPPVEVVEQPGHGQGEAAGEQAERQHRPVEDLSAADAELHPVPDGEEEHRGEHPVGQSDRRADAEILPDHHRPARHRLADDREHRAVLDLAGEHPGGREGGEQQPGDEQGAEAEVHEQLVVLAEGERGQVHVQHEGQDAGQHDDDVHRLTDRLQEPVAGDRHERHGNPLEP
jgi:hypothetical protein